MAAPDPELRDGEVFAGHRITGIAGRGGMGVVYRADQLDLERPVALKLIAGSLAADPDFRARFIREARAAAAIDHPNVIPVYSAGEEDGRLYLAMRLIEGDDLRSLVRRGGPLAPDRAARIIAQVGAALDAAHARGLIHRDIKPANVLLDDEHAYLTDFGLTKRLDGETTVTGSGRWVGTLGYVAPEQIRGEPVDARADVYALGCLLFYVLTGVAPYRRDSDEATLYAHLHEPPPDARDVVPDLPGALADVVRRALEKDPADRFPSAGDLGRAALAAVGDAPAPPPERIVARGAAAPGAEQTAVSPSDTPTELAATRAAGARVRRWLAPALSLLAGAAVVVIAALLLSGGGSHDVTASTATTARTAIGPGDLHAAAPLDVDPRPTSITYAKGRIWVTSATRNRLTGLPADGRGKVRRVALPFRGGATSVAAGFDSLWVTNGSASQLARIGLPDGTVRKVIDLPAGDAVLVATGEDAVWVGRREARSGQPSSIVKIDPRRDAIAGQVEVGEEGVAGLAAGGGFVWLTNAKRPRITRIDPHARSGKVRRSRIVGARPRGVAYGGGRVWIAHYDDFTLGRLPRSLDNVTVRRTVAAPLGVAYSGVGVWVAGYLADAVALHDPRTGDELARVNVGSNPFAITAHGDRAWVTNLADGTVTPLSIRPR